MIFFTCIYIVNKYANKKTANFIIVTCLIIQLLDLYPSFKNKFEYKEEIYDLDKIAWEQLLDGAEHIAYINFEKDSYDDMRESFYKIAYIADENNCTLNNFYFARVIKNTDETFKKHVYELINGDLNNRYVYVIKQQNDINWWNNNLNSFKLDGYIVIAANKTK